MADDNYGSEAVEQTVPDSFPKAYGRLRTVLDGLEAMSLHYCLRDANPSERIKRAKELDALLMPVLTQIQDSMKLQSRECPEGFFSCGGCCVPYQCPEFDS